MNLAEFNLDGMRVYRASDVDPLFDKLRESIEEYNFCFLCLEHPLHGHAKDCIFYGEKEDEE